MRRVGLICALLIGTPAVVHAAQPDKANITVKKDLVYCTVNGEKLALDLAMPKEGNGPFPTVVCVHGGGWRAGKRQDLNKLIELLAEKGFVAATISYRLTDKAKFPAQIEDCKAAVRWLRANAKEYKIDPEKIGAVGFSAGGHLVCLLGAADESNGLEGTGGNDKQSSRVQAVVSFFGPTDFINKSWNKQVEDFYLVPFLGDSFDKAKEKYANASPIKYVTKDDPPFLFFHGDKDQLVGLHNSVDMCKKLKEAGVPAEVVIIEGAGHGWGGQQLDDTLERTVKFFAEKLKK